MNEGRAELGNRCLQDKVNASTWFNFRSLRHIFRAIFKIPFLNFLYLFIQVQVLFASLASTALVYSNCLIYAKLEDKVIPNSSKQSLLF